MNIRFIQLVLVNDYHEFQAICDAFPNLNLEYVELGTTNTNSGVKYVGVVFEGYSPGPGEVDDLLLISKVKLNSDVY